MKDALIITIAAAESDDECDHLAGQVHNKSPTRDSKYFYAKKHSIHTHIFVRWTIGSLYLGFPPNFWRSGIDLMC